MSHLGVFSDDCRLIRQASPIVHNITNYVAMHLSANALLAIGASPIMSSEVLEIKDLAELCDSLVINIGCLERAQMDAMYTAAAEMERLGKPWVLDPAGAGASRLRTGTAEKLLHLHPSVVRGNASEIMTLAGACPRQRGVDASEKSSDAVPYARELARAFGTVVVVSGPADYITDGNEVESIANGSPMMHAVTAMGCTASAVTAAFLGVDRNAMNAAACAMALMGLAGEKAAEGSTGPGTFAVNFIDALACLNPEEASKMIRNE